MRAQAVDPSASETRSGTQGHPSPLRTARTPSLMPTPKVSRPPFFRLSLSLASGLPHSPKVWRGDMQHLGVRGPRGPHPHPTGSSRARVLRRGGCTAPGGSAKARRPRVPGLGDPQVASVRHGHDARGPADAASAHTSAAGRASALTCLTF